VRTATLDQQNEQTQKKDKKRNTPHFRPWGAETTTCN
jgi:hypothetical protein